MLRPAGGSGGLDRHSPLLAGALLAGLAAVIACDAGLAAPAARAVAQSGRTLSDTTGTTMLRHVGGGRTEAMRKAARNGDYGPEQRAQELYLDGMEKLEAGHREWAERTFEDLIARFPETSAAALARRRLGHMEPEASVEPVALPPRPVEVEPAKPPAAREPEEDRAAAWAGVLRRNAALQTRLREQAGDRVFFATGSAELGSRARMALVAQAQWLKTWHEFEAAIEGHADEPGSDEENFRLSMQRAETVRQRLVEEGVDAARLAIVAVGRGEPVATCESPECHAQNRRVVTLVFTSGTHKRLGLVTAAQPLAPEPTGPSSATAQPATDGTQ